MMELAETFCQNYPELLQGKLDCVSMALIVSFNRRGTLLAVGCNDGRIVIWDFLTRCMAKIIIAHVHPVCSLSWSRSGRKLLSSSTDYNVCIWDVVTGDCLRKYRFPCIPLFAQFDPKSELECLVCPLRHQALFMNRRAQHTYLPLGADADRTLIAVFDRKGRNVYLGNSKGTVLILNVTNFNILTEFKIPCIGSTPISIRSIEFSRKDQYFVLNCSDRIIRLYRMDIVLKNKELEAEPLAKFQDIISKSMWKKCAFSGDGEFICAGTVGSHHIYIWEVSSGSLTKILHGNKVEVLLDVAWHPYKSIIVSVGSGVISVWAQNPVETWAAYCPDFKEIDENCDYEESESEFDEADEDKSTITNESKQNQENTIDVTNANCGTSNKGSDEESDHCDVDVLSMVPVIEDPDVVKTIITPKKGVIPKRKPGRPPKKIQYPYVETIDTPTKKGLKLRIRLGPSRK